VNAQEAWLALSRADLPPRVATQLLEAFGDAVGVFAAPPDELTRKAPLTPRQISRIAAAAAFDYSGDLRTLRDIGARLVTVEDDAYPADLRHIPDPPTAIYVRGDLSPADHFAIAIVGSRRSSPYGQLVAHSLARELAARRITVVSGLAMGIDTAAHRGALEGGGRTIAVMACGIDLGYPAANRELKERIVAQGAVMSEFPLGAPALAARIPARNRLISGLALGTVVVEAHTESGSLITAHHALEQGREVFAVPGSVSSAQSKGTHRLIKDGAKLVESVEDILEEIDLSGMAQAVEASEPAVAPGPSLAPEEARVLALLSLQQKYVDEVIQESGFGASQTNAVLMMLELKGLVRRLPGNLFLRVR
jgi:DNA processing protein